jgi:competence protein ComEA
MSKIRWGDDMDLTKREKIGLTTFIIIMLIVVSLMYFTKNKNDSVEVISKNAIEGSIKQDDNPERIVTHTDNNIEVYISGEIKKPGVYKLLAGDRAEKLVSMAGGFTNNADTTGLNLAMKLKDEDYIKVPNKLQITSNQNNINSNINSINSIGKSGDSAIININTASIEELKTLPRIGDALAQRIIDYREKTGSFKDIKDLDNVSGIGPKMFENIKDKITVH